MKRLPVLYFISVAGTADSTPTNLDDRRSLVDPTFSFLFLNFDVRTGSYIHDKYGHSADLTRLLDYYVTYSTVQSTTYLT
ncbi:hypothetical protein J3F83DRAFT_729882 [Trichoderma novae-zelandiae]